MQRLATKTSNLNTGKIKQSKNINEKEQHREKEHGLKTLKIG